MVLERRGQKGATLNQIAAWHHVSKPYAKKMMTRIIVMRGITYYKGKYYSPYIQMESQAAFRYPTISAPTAPTPIRIVPAQPVLVERVWVKLTARFDYDDEDRPLHLELSREIEVLRGQEDQAKSILMSLMEQWVDNNYGPQVARRLQFGEPRYEGSGSTGMIVRHKRGATQPWQQRLLV